MQAIECGDVRQSRTWRSCLVLMMVASLLGCAGEEDTAGDELRTVSNEAASGCGWLRSGETLWRGGSVKSCNGEATLIHQTDGNTVEYDGVGATWWTGTDGMASNRLVMQTDGNLVLYDSSNQPLWYSGTNGNPGAALAVQDDCNMVIYSTSGAVLWTNARQCRAHPPAAPTGPTATAISGSQIRVTWADASNNESGFEVHNGVTSVTVPANSTSYTWGGLANGTYMCFMVRAVNAVGSSAWTSYACTSTLTPPAAPTGPTATAISGSQIRITWADASNNESGFEVHNGVTSVTVPANSTSYTWGGLTNGTYMCFMVRAVNAAGSSAWTSYACTSTLTPPAAPTGQTATAISGSQIRVTWADASNNESGFEVHNGVTSVTVPANSTSYTWGGLANGTYMCFMIRAVNAAGSSAWTPYACTSTLN